MKPMPVFLRLYKGKETALFAIQDEKDHMNHHHHREAHLKQQMQGLMTEQMHGYKATEASAKGTHAQQNRFRDPPSALLRSALIPPHQNKIKDIHNQQIKYIVF